MEEDFHNKMQSIAANSNLVATAGEFVPKSVAHLQRFGNEQLNHEQNIYGTSSFNNYNFQIPETFNNYTVVENGTPSSSSYNMPYVSQYSVVGESSKSSNCLTNSVSSKNSLCYSNQKGYKYYKPNQCRNPRKWLRSVNESQCFSGKSVNESEPNHQVQKQYEKKKLIKSIAKGRNENYNNFTKPFYYEKKESNVESEYHYNNNLDIRYVSRQYQDKFNRSDQPNQNHFVNKYKYNNKENKDYSGIDFFKNKSQGTVKESNRKHSDFNNSKHTEFKKVRENRKIGETKMVTSRREQLIDMLTRGILECLVCCELIYQSNPVWSCATCYHVLHLKCVIKWAKSSKSEFGWRCPACQNVTNSIPDYYYCFCGKVKNPEWNHHDCPHSCGEVCSKSHRKSCPHKCTLLCHPGPCPQCTATISKSCRCGKTVKAVNCGGSEEIVCDKICEKELNCMIHTCQKKCHIDECQECNEVIAQDCFCQKSHRDVKCSIESLGVDYYSCGKACKKELNCGNHFCDRICHEGECAKCEVTPSLVKFCPCGKTELNSLGEKERKLCTDPIPTCDLICGKILNCGSTVKRHTCREKCHEGPCPDCTLETMVKCRCGHMDKMVPCSKLNDFPDGVLCNKRCNKKRSCGKHKCNKVCCTGLDHKCTLPCNRFLQCGLHRCEETCHKGHCKPCLQASFDEFSCECGAEVIFPPVPCGTRRPPCDRPCTRVHACDHPPVHSCHSANQCPPCTVLTKKYCHGRHELRKAVPCHQDSFSCGLPCGKELPCGKHKCILPCHSGSCLKPGQCCTQPCTNLRLLCGHICGMPCHEGPCSTDTPCKEMVRVTCECGHRFTTKGCHDNATEFQRIATIELATKMADLQAGQSIDLNEFVSASKKLSYNTLECNDECKLIERNRKLALALQIRNPDLTSKLTPRYSEYLKTWAKRDARFCQMVHDKLTDLVQLAKQSKQKSRSFSFDPMNREKRHFIHEYGEHFGCETVAYDKEPKRNVVATALKDKSWLPSVSIIEFVRKENSPRKVPAPVMAKAITSTPQKGMELLSKKNLAASQQSEGGEGSSFTGSNEPQIDYFDWRPQNP